MLFRRVSDADNPLFLATRTDVLGECHFLLPATFLPATFALCMTPPRDPFLEGLCIDGGHFHVNNLSPATDLRKSFDLRSVRALPGMTHFEIEAWKPNGYFRIKPSTHSPDLHAVEHLFLNSILLISVYFRFLLSSRQDGNWQLCYVKCYSQTLHGCRCIFPVIRSSC